MGVFGELTGLGKAFWDRGLNGVGEFIRGIAGRAGLDNVADVGERLAGFGQRLPIGKLLRRVSGSEILDAGQVVIVGMRLTTGVGEPESGDRFGQGSSRFHDVGGTLTSAFPDDSWAGEGAEAYVDQNRQQLDRTNTVALLDRGVQTVLAREAYQVKYHRDKLDDQSNFLADLSYMTMALAFVPGVGKAMKYAIETAAVNAALGICSLELYELSREANQNAAQLHQAAGLYADVTAAANMTATEVPPAPPPPPPSGGAPQERPQPGRPAGRDEPRGNSPVPTRPAGRPSKPSSAPAVPRGRAAGLGVEPPQEPLAEPSGVPQVSPGAAPGADALDQLGSLLAPLGSLLAGAGQPSAQPPAPPVAPTTGAPQTPVGETGTKDKEQKKRQSDENGPSDNEDDGARGHDESGRAPVHVEVDVDPDRLQAPVTVRLEPDRPSVPRAATTPQE